MRSLASGFTFEKLRACLNCIARAASVTAKRANLADARLRLDLDPTNGCCKATPLRSAPLSSWGTSLSGALGRVTLFSGRPEMKPTPQGTEARRSRRWCSRGHLEPLSATPHGFELGRTQFVPSWVNNSLHPLSRDYFLKSGWPQPLRGSLLLSRGSNPNRGLGSISGRCLRGDSCIRMSVMGH